MEDTLEKVEIPLVEESEKPKFLENYINQAIDLVRSQRYKQAIKYLENTEMAKAAGIEFDNEAGGFILRETPDKEKIREVSDLVAYNSEFIHIPGKVPKLKVAYIYTLGPELTNKPRPYVPPEMWQEVALIHLEEWLHALQYLKRTPLAGYEDKELDVGEYLKQKEVPLTENFVQRGHG